MRRRPAPHAALAAIALGAVLTAPLSVLAQEGGWRPPGYDGPLAEDAPGTEAPAPSGPSAVPTEAARERPRAPRRERPRATRRERPRAQPHDDEATREDAIDEDAIDEDDPPSPWNVGLDVSLGVAQVEFPAVDVPEEVAAATGQAPAARTTEVVRLIASAGFGGLALEGGLTTSLSGGDYLGWTLGVRLESSWDASFAIAFRAAYVERLDVDGQGARVGIGVVGRPTLALSLYAEAWTEATSIPDGMHLTGALFSYVVSGSAGVRVAFR
ncbi:MAG: hypothetical protein IT379_23920 [Deltaproteobacteria bacterium]|nr:hypothetical protein [Deltaproteobacteria bacterium]